MTMRVNVALASIRTLKETWAQFALICIDRVYTSNHANSLVIKFRFSQISITFRQTLARWLAQYVNIVVMFTLCFATSLVVIWDFTVFWVTHAKAVIIKEISKGNFLAAITEKLGRHVDTVRRLLKERTFSKEETNILLVFQHTGIWGILVASYMANLEKHFIFILEKERRVNSAPETSIIAPNITMLPSVAVSKERSQMKNKQAQFSCSWLT